MNKLQPKKVQGYGRASTTDQQLTPIVQESLIENWFEKTIDNKERFPNGGRLLPFMFDTISAGIPLLDRPNGQHLLTSLDPGDIVVFPKFTRAFRSGADTEMSLDTFRQARVELVFLDLDIDTHTPNGQFIAGVMGAYARLERDMISERTREAKQAQKRACLPTNANPPAGWKIAGRGTKRPYYVVNQEQRELARAAAQILRTNQGTRVLKAMFSEYYREQSRTNKYSANITRALIRMASLSLVGFPKIGLTDLERITGQNVGCAVFCQRSDAYYNKIRAKILDEYPLAYSMSERQPQE